MHFFFIKNRVLVTKLRRIRANDRNSFNPEEYGTYLKWLGSGVELFNRYETILATSMQIIKI